MERILGEKEIIHIMKGAALMGAGGGGSLNDGMVLFNAYKKKEQNMQCKLIDIEDMDSDSCSVGMAVMGAPTAGFNLDLTPCVTNAYQEAKSILTRIGKTAGYALSLELGGFNTFTAILLSMIEGLPLLDADCAGRAVPGLETAVSAINGLPTAPFAMADIDNNHIDVFMKDANDADFAQDIASPIARAFGQNAGMAGWFYNKSELGADVPANTISFCEKLGAIFDTALEYKNHLGLKYIPNVFTSIAEQGLTEARSLVEHGKVTQYVVGGQTGNNDVGYYDISCLENPEKRYRIHFANENLVIGKMVGEEESVIMTAPDVITMYNAETGYPLTNEDLHFAKEDGSLAQMVICLGIMKVDAIWWRHEDRLPQLWSRYFEEINYEGDIIKYRNV